MSKLVYKAQAKGESWDRPLTTPCCDSPAEAQMYFFGHYPNKRSCEITGYVNNGDDSGMVYFTFGCPTYKKVTKNSKFEMVQESQGWQRIA